MANDVENWLSAQFSFSGRRVLVTGASRGIGRALAAGFARAGADLILTARDPASLEATMAEVTGLGRKARAIACDQRDVAAIRDAFGDLGPVDVLVNNAGT